MYRVLIAILSVGLLAVGRPADAALSVLTTTTDLAAIAQAVGGELVDAESLTPGTRDPHFAEARPSMIRKIYGADLLLVVGAQLEIGWLPAALQAGRNARLTPGNPGYLDLSATVRLLDVRTGEISRAMGDVHAAGNPHYWLDPRNGRPVARAIAARLVELDPENAGAYQQRLGAFEQQLDQGLGRWRAAMAPFAGRKFLSYHRSMIYLADAFEFELVGEIEPLPGISPTASHLADLVNGVRADNVAGILIEPFYDPKPAEFVGRQTGAPVIVVPQSVGALPGIATYFDLFDAIVAAFARAGTT